MPVRFFSQQVRFSLKKKTAAVKLIRLVIRKEKKKEGQLNFIFCSDTFLHALNKKFLKHDTLTDIITFPAGQPAVGSRQSPSYASVSAKATADKKASAGKAVRRDRRLGGEIYVSVRRVRENAKKFKVPFDNELSRVMVHGVLHLCGYKDKRAGEKKEMRKKEDYYLSRQ